MGKPGRKPIPENEKTSIDKTVAVRVIKERVGSLRRIDVDRNAGVDLSFGERTLRRYLEDSKIPIRILDELARYLNVHPDYLSGEYDRKLNMYADNPDMKELYKKMISPYEYPMLDQERRDFDYKGFFESIYVANAISSEQLAALQPEKRIELNQKMLVAMLRVLTEFFQVDGYGRDLSEEMRYAESLVGVIDPHSSFAIWEGVGIDEADIYSTASDSEEEEKLADKYRDGDEL